jgi:hypothetical protein
MGTSSVSIFAVHQSNSAAALAHPMLTQLFVDFEVNIAWVPPIEGEP